jgi:hypothetical protein
MSATRAAMSFGEGGTGGQRGKGEELRLEPADSDGW